jgi:N utilization substance protein B
MSNRHLARTVAMQTLYEWDFNGARSKDLEGSVESNMNEFAPGLDDKGFAKELVSGVLEHQQEIDSIITKYAPAWPLPQITIVDRNILRIGVFELKWSDSVPSKVAINEAIEMAKTFGGESSGRFVNGVLGAIFKDMIAAGQLKEVDKQEPKKKAESPESKESDAAGDEVPESRSDIREPEKE